MSMDISFLQTMLWTIMISLISTRAKVDSSGHTTVQHATGILQDHLYPPVLQLFSRVIKKHANKWVHYELITNHVFSLKKEGGDPDSEINVGNLNWDHIVLIIVHIDFFHWPLEGRRSYKKYTERQVIRDTTYLNKMWYSCETSTIPYYHVFSDNTLVV